MPTDQKVPTGPAGPAGSNGLPQSISFDQLGVAPPMDNATTAMAGGTLYRHVYGHVLVTNTATDAGVMVCLVENGVGTGVYEAVQRTGSNTLLAMTSPYPFSFMVPTGRRYKFQKIGAATVTFGAYSFAEV